MTKAAPKHVMLYMLVDSIGDYTCSDVEIEQSDFSKFSAPITCYELQLEVPRRHAGNDGRTTVRAKVLSTVTRFDCLRQ